MSSRLKRAGLPTGRKTNPGERERGGGSPKPWPGARAGREGCPGAGGEAGGRGAAQRLKTTWLAPQQARARHREGKAKRRGVRPGIKGRRVCASGGKQSPSGSAESPPSHKKKGSPTFINRQLRLQRGTGAGGGARAHGEGRRAGGASNKWARRPARRRRRPPGAQGAGLGRDPRGGPRGSRQPRTPRVCKQRAPPCSRAPPPRRLEEPAGPRELPALGADPPPLPPTPWRRGSSLSPGPRGPGGKAASRGGDSLGGPAAPLDQVLQLALREKGARERAAGGRVGAGRGPRRAGRAARTLRSRLLRMHSAAKTCSPTLLSSSMLPRPRPLRGARRSRTAAPPRARRRTQSTAPAREGPPRARAAPPRPAPPRGPANPAPANERARAGRGRGAHCSRRARPRARGPGPRGRRTGLGWPGPSRGKPGRGRGGAGRGAPRGFGPGESPAASGLAPGTRPAASCPRLRGALLRGAPGSAGPPPVELGLQVSARALLCAGAEGPGRNGSESAGGGRGSSKHGAAPAPQRREEMHPRRTRAAVFSLQAPRFRAHGGGQEVHLLFDAFEADVGLGARFRAVAVA